MNIHNLYLPYPNGSNDLVAVFTARVANSIFDAKLNRPWRTNLQAMPGHIPVER